MRVKQFPSSWMHTVSGSMTMWCLSMVARGNCQTSHYILGPQIGPKKHVRLIFNLHAKWISAVPTKHNRTYTQHRTTHPQINWLSSSSIVSRLSNHENFTSTITDGWRLRTQLYLLYPSVQERVHRRQMAQESCTEGQTTRQSKPLETESGIAVRSGYLGP